METRAHPVQTYPGSDDIGWTPVCPVAAERTLYHEDFLQPHIFLQVHDPS